MRYSYYGAVESKSADHIECLKTLRPFCDHTATDGSCHFCKWRMHGQILAPVVDDAPFDGPTSFQAAGDCVVCIML